MADEKIYTPEVITDQPFPVEDAAVSQVVTVASENGTYSPATIQPKPIPVKRIAHELFAESLNTKNRRILAEFQFTESGALQIGKYENGVSGDIRITPNGITARDITGATTFAIDATTGNATFKGTVQAAGFDIIDDNGLVSLSAFKSGEQMSKGGSQTTASGTPAIVTGSEMVFDLIRSTKVLFLATAAGSSVSNNGISVIINVDGIRRFPALYAKSFLGGFDWAGGTAHAILTLDKGSHTIKLEFDSASGAGGDDATIITWRFSYIILGT